MLTFGEMAGRPKVYSVAIEVTAHCQQKCAYCYNAWREDNGAGMEAGGAKKLHARVEKLLSAMRYEFGGHLEKKD